MWRQVRMAVVAVVVVASVLLVFGRVGQNTEAVSEAERDARTQQVALQVMCEVSSALAEAGREIIRGPGGRVDPRREVIGATYARGVANRVQAITGRRDLVRADGSLDCARLRGVAR